MERRHQLKRSKTRFFANLSKSISLLNVIISWGLAVLLVMQLLSGPFGDGRTCQTTCVKILFWTSFAVALFGLVFGVTSILLGKRDLILILSSLALLSLSIIYVTTILIGTFGI